jgi:hypothetical protein
LAQVDGKVKVVVADCKKALSDPVFNQCIAGQGGKAVTDQTQPYTLDAWRKMGQGFITAGGGVVYAFKENLGAQLNINLMYMLPTSGPVIEPSIGIVYGL